MDSLDIPVGVTNDHYPFSSDRVHFFNNFAKFGVQSIFSVTQSEIEWQRLVSEPCSESSIFESLLHFFEIDLSTESIRTNVLLALSVDEVDDVMIFDDLSVYFHLEFVVGY